MKKIWGAFIAMAFILSTCDNSFLSMPLVPSDEYQNSKNEAPGNVTVSHGEKRSINIKWDAVPNTALYYVYKASSPLDLFVKCGETS